MQKMTHEKTWSVVPSPHVPKYTQLFDNKADFIKLNSGVVQFVISTVQGLCCEFNFTVHD